MTILIPQAGCLLTLTDEWEVTVDWRKRNLRMLKAFKLTGMKVTGKRGYITLDENGAYNYEQRDARETVPNKLFMDDDGNYAPVELRFPIDSIFEISRFNSGYYKIDYVDGTEGWARGAIGSVDLKCYSSPMKGLKGLCLQLPIKVFNGCPATISNCPDVN